MNKKPTLTLIEDLFSQSRDYIDSRIELIKLQAIDKASKGAASVVSVMVLALFLIIFFLFFNIALALFLGDLVGKTYIGFLIVSLVYVIAGFILFKARRKILTKPIANMLIRKFL